MFGLFGAKAAHKDIAGKLYETLNVQARQEVFFTAYNVADTTDGRFDLLCLHSFLIMSRLQKEGKEGHLISQALFDVMFKQLEYALREMGVGDLSVPRHVKRMMTAYKGRCFAYQEAIKSDDNGMLEEVIKRNLYGHDECVAPEKLQEMAAYLRDNHTHIQDLDEQSFYAGENLFATKLSEEREDHDKSRNARMVA